jgi:hypothetical protein
MQLADFIVCDDVRFEMGNKMSIMGIYDDSILIPPPGIGSELLWPLAMRLSFFIRMHPTAHDAAINGFEFIVTHEGEKIAFLDGAIAIRDPSKPLRLAISLSQLLLPSLGKLSFKIVLKNGSEVISETDVPHNIRIALLDDTPSVPAPA